MEVTRLTPVTAAGLPSKSPRGPEAQTWDGVLRPRPSNRPDQKASQHLLLRLHWPPLEESPLKEATEDLQILKNMSTALPNKHETFQNHCFLQNGTAASGRSGPCAECKKTLNSSSFPEPALCCESKKGSRFLCDVTNPSRSLSESMTSPKNETHRITQEMK